MGSVLLSQYDLGGGRNGGRLKRNGKEVALTHCYLERLVIFAFFGVLVLACRARTWRGLVLFLSGSSTVTEWPQLIITFCELFMLENMMASLNARPAPSFGLSVSAFFSLLTQGSACPSPPGISHQSRGAGVAGADSAGSSQGTYLPRAQASARSYALPNPMRGIRDTTQTTQDIASPPCLQICPFLCLEYSSSLPLLALNFADAVLPGLVVKIWEMLPYRLAHHFCPES